jgi:hypothetical protein
MPIRAASFLNVVSMRRAVLEDKTTHEQTPSGRAGSSNLQRTLSNSESGFGGAAAAFFGLIFLASPRSQHGPSPIWAQEPKDSMARPRKRAGPPDQFPARPCKHVRFSFELLAPLGALRFTLAMRRPRSHAGGSEP